VEHIDRANILNSWALQTAIICAFALSTFGVTFVLRRSAMRALSALWTLYVSAAATGLAASYLSEQGSHPSLMLVLMTLSPGFVLASLPANVQLLDAVSEHPRPWRAWRRTSVTFGIAACIVIGIGTVGGPLLWPGSILATGTWPRAWNTIMYLATTAYAWHLSRRDAAHRAALRLLAVGFAMMGARVGINIVVGSGLLAAWSDLASNLGISSVQVFSIVTFGVLSLLAVLQQERTVLLLQAEQLREAQSRVAASQRMESLGRLSAGVAHDFNNILHAITAGADLARGSIDDRASLEAELTAIEDAAARAVDLTRQLQLFARAQPQKPMRFDVNCRLDGVTALLHRLLSRGVELSVAASPEPLMVQMDPSRLEQVIMNLVVNARDAMPSGGTIRIETSVEIIRSARVIGDAELPPGRYAKLTVSDSGAGIAPGVLPHIFEPFFTTKEGGHGSGIGLATCQSIALEAKGAIAVHSVMGEGTRFDVLLPVEA
jgi:signal transduction histidine kinase